MSKKGEKGNKKGEKTEDLDGDDARLNQTI
jgi:hypothetical protein